MKRSLNSEHSIGSDEKRHHSMFSITTVVKETDDDPELRICCTTEELREKIAAMEKSSNGRDESSHRRQPSCASAIPTDNSSSSDDFFIEDEDEEVPASLNPFNPLISSRTVEDSVNVTEAKEIAKEEALVESIVPHQADKEEKGELKTGIVFEASTQHFDRHNRFHKERPVRVTSIYDALVKAGLQERCSLFEQRHSETETCSDLAVSSDDASPEANFLNDEDFLRVHLPGYMQRLDNLSGCTCHDKLDREAGQFQSIFFTPDSVRQAKAAASALCRLVSRVVQTSDLDNGFAVIRPPGHHAEPGLAGGYCVVNNVAVAAAYAREKLGVERVLVVDWDVHHGNGTQRIFLNDPAVLYFSVHRWHGGNFFPFLKNGGATTVGVGEGAGFNVNVGWSRKGMGDDEYEAVWTKVLMPMAREYQPDLVLVSAGFDAADGDMGECNVTPECFGMLTRSLKTLADGKVICSLEGGYVRGVLGECVKQVVSALLEPKSACEQQVSEEAEDGTDILEEIDPSAAKNIRATIAAHQTYWKCFQQG